MKLRKSDLALAAVCLSSLMFGLEISSIPAILPTLDRMLHASFQQLQWTMNAYTLAVATVLMAAGTLADRYGRKRVFIAGVVAFGLTSLVCGLTPDMPILIAARALQGAAGGVMLICQVAVLSAQFASVGDRAKAFGWWGIIFGIGLGFGPVIGHGVVVLLGWPWVFLVHAVLAVVTVVLAVAGVNESRDPVAKHLDIAGVTLLSLSVFCLVFFITQGSTLGFLAPVALGVAAITVASFVAFILVERAQSHPMVDFSVFRVRRFSGALVGSAGMNFSFWPFMIYLPIWIEAKLGLSGVAAGSALLAYTLPTLITPTYAERMLLRRGPAVVIPLGLFTIGAGFLIMRGAAGAGSVILPLTLLGAAIAGAGLGMTNTPVTNTTTAAVSADRAGMASGLDMSARMISLAVNIAIMGLILVAGVLASLVAAHPEMNGASALASAQRIAAGGAIANSEIATPLAASALSRGFEWVLAYGTVSAWMLAGVSLLTFRAKTAPVLGMEQADR